MKNKYADVGVALGTVADYFYQKGGTPVEKDFHAILRRMVGIMEDQAEEIDILKRRIENLEEWLKKNA